MRFQELLIESTALAGMVGQRDAYIDDWEDLGCGDETEAEIRFDELFELFTDLPDPFPVYRGMGVTPEWLDAIRRGASPNLGVHWTYDPDAARHDLGGHGHSLYRDPEARQSMTKIVLVAKVRKDAVDWDWTFGKNMPYPDEAEIHITGAEVYLDHIRVGGKKIVVGRSFPTGSLDIPEFEL